MLSGVQDGALTIYLSQNHKPLIGVLKDRHVDISGPIILLTHSSDGTDDTVVGQRFALVLSADHLGHV